MRRLEISLGLFWCISASIAEQVPLASSAKPSREPPFTREREDVNGSSHYKLPSNITRVAVIGAGPNGLIHASTLLENGFEVRLFERAPKPGGTWFYSDKTPIAASFP